MKILLIAPIRNTGHKTRDIIRFPMISLLYIAALTPQEHGVRILEEENEELDYNIECDLVGITCMTATAGRAYIISEEFRKRGKKVVLGGIHPTVLPQEAKVHCDSVIIGEAEPVWGQMLKDSMEDNLQDFYHGGTVSDLNEYPLPRRDLIKHKPLLGAEPIVTSRGCPYSCEFCSVWKFFGRRIRHVPVKRVVEDIQNAQSSTFMFMDDNIVGNPIYAKELFNELKDQKIKWVGQASISFAGNSDLLKLAHQSGCRGLFFGLETVSEQKMKRMSKSMKTQKDTIETIKKIMDHGIYFHASLVFGFDDDDDSVFDETLEFLYKTKIPSATFNILTPYPGTDIYDKFKKQGRLITENWDYYDHCTVTYLPGNMTVDRLYEGYQYVKKNYYGLGHILNRFPANRRNPLIFTLANTGLKLGIDHERKMISSTIDQLHSMIEENNKRKLVDEAQ